MQDNRLKPKTVAVTHLTAALKRLQGLDNVFGIAKVAIIQTYTLDKTGVAVVMGYGVIHTF